MPKLGVQDFDSFAGRGYEDLFIRQEVNMCPICHKGIQTKIINYAYGQTKRFSKRGRRRILGEPVETLGIICMCPICKELIYATYGDFGHQEVDDTYRNKWELIEVFPYAHQKEEFKEVINQICPEFSKIYNQAKQAENMGLDQICGMGYRKALEFLVKDYAKKEHPDKIEQIETDFLGKCINQYIEHSKIKECARRASWLGNDECHYKRTWEDKDISDLKNLINLTMAWIDIEEGTKAYTTDMNPQTRG